MLITLGKRFKYYAQMKFTKTLHIRQLSVLPFDIAQQHKTNFIYTGSKRFSNIGYLIWECIILINRLKWKIVV